MKKLLVIACVLVLALGTFAGCGGGDKAAEAPAEQPAVQEEQADAPAEETPAAETPQVTDERIKAFVSQTNDAFSVVNEQTKGLMEMSVEAEGNTVIFTYQMFIDLGDSEAAKTAVEDEMRNQEEAMTQAVAQLREEGIEDPVVRLVFIDKDGNEIVSQDYK